MLFVDNDWITSHFGKNPKNGGSPPKDNNEAIKKIFIVGKL